VTVDKLLAKKTNDLLKFIHLLVECNLYQTFIPRECTKQNVHFNTRLAESTS